MPLKFYEALTNQDQVLFSFFGTPPAPTHLLPLPPTPAPHSPPTHLQYHYREQQHPLELAID